MDAIIELNSDWLYYGNVRIANPDHVAIPGGVTAVTGPNGAGKTTLAAVLAHGRNFRTNNITMPRSEFTVRQVEFTDIHSLGSNRATYYQQRYEATMNDEIATVAEAIGSVASDGTFLSWSRRLGIDGILEKRINYLSSGELRKLLVARALTGHPGLLILDIPYIGLDAASRETLDAAIKELPRQGVSVMLLVCDAADIPDFTDTVIPVKDMRLMPAIKADRPVSQLREAMTQYFDYAIDLGRLPRPVIADNEPLTSIATLRDCRVDYNGVTVIDHIDWDIKEGENWALAGPNGSGKSTLLSLITADHPRCYSNDITVFGHRRGTGESIWDIKRRIGYVSPEMKLYFNTDTDVETVIAQGLNDTIGNYANLTPAQKQQGRQWLEMLHLDHLARRRFSSLSAGERQLVLVARAMIKQPRLLILDEPMHGLDYARKRAVKALINHFAARSAMPDSRYRTTLIYVTHYASEIPECVTHTKTLSRPK